MTVLKDSWVELLSSCTRESTVCCRRWWSPAGKVWYRSVVGLKDREESGLACKGSKEWNERAEAQQQQRSRSYHTHAQTHEVTTSVWQQLKMVSCGGEGEGRGRPKDDLLNGREVKVRSPTTTAPKRDEGRTDEG